MTTVRAKKAQELTVEYIVGRFFPIHLNIINLKGGVFSPHSPHPVSDLVSGV